MKKTILVLVGVSIALLSQSASADHRWGRGYDRYYGYGYGSHYYPYYGRPGFYVGYSRGRRHHHGFSTGSFIGGLVLGSVLTYPRYRDRYYRRTPVRTSEVRVVQRSVPSTVTVTSSRRLLRDLEGRCFEIQRDGSGTEIRTELEPEACNF